MSDLIIERGKFYRSEGGTTYGPMVPRTPVNEFGDDKDYVWKAELSTGFWASWTKYGEYVKDAPSIGDLVEEVPCAI